MTRRLSVSLLCLLALAIAAAPAQAGKGVVSSFGSGGSEAGQFANAAGTAVDTTTGDVYVSDQFNNRVQRFDSEGKFISTFGWGVTDGEAKAEICTENCQAGLEGSGAGQFLYAPGIAIDQATQQLYVVDQNNNRVERFDSEGHFLSAFGWGVADGKAELQTCTSTCQAGEAGSGEGQLSGPQGIAVDPTDESVYVADFSNQRVEHFDKAGAYLSTFGSEGTEDGQFEGPTRVAVDSTGRVYVIDSGNVRIERFTKAGAFDEVFDTTDVFFPQEIAIGPANDHLYVAQWAQDFSEQHVVEIDESGTLVNTHAVGSTATESFGLALSTGNQRIYLANGFSAKVFILDDLTAPTATIEPAANVTSSSADLSGTVTPNGSPNVGWHFEVSTDDANWSPVAADQDAGNGNTAVPVAQSLTGLIPNTTYFVRLSAARPFNAPTRSSEIQFTTDAIAPSVTTESADDVTSDHAVLTGLVNPNHSSTTYYFEYGPTTSYGTSVPATQDADGGAANAVEAVLRRIDGLTSGTLYHYRLVAHNQAATTNGADQTFTTGTPPPASTPRAGIPGSGFLPDNRGWEKVSPANKNGGDVLPDSARTRVAADGNAANFASLSAFAGAIGTSASTDYMSVRQPDGWTTHAITPKQAPLTTRTIQASLQSLYSGAFSDDLARGVFIGWSPVTNDPNVANVANIYLRDDLKTSGAGSYQLLSACPLCADTSTPLPALPNIVQGGAPPFFAGASADDGHVLFESQQPLTSDAPTGCTDLGDTSQCPGNLYEWDHGTVRLVGILPDNTTAHGSQAGQGAGSFQGANELTPHTVSADGSRIVFTVPDGAGTQSGALYMRIDHTTTVQLDSSESASPSSNSATYWDASTDGMRVFFTTSDALTDDAPPGGNKLYMYDASKPDSDPHNLTLLSVDNEPADGVGDVLNVQGASSDGHYVYFAAFGQLVSGGPKLPAVGLYVWHDGIVTFIADVANFPDNPEDTNTTEWNARMPTARVTPDGLHMLFSSTAQGAGPTGYDQGHCTDNSLGAGCREFYLYSFASQRLACASCDPSGAPATTSAFGSIRTNFSVASTTSTLNHALSDDGNRVLFSTAAALVPKDINGKADVYEYDAPSGTVHLITPGTARSDSYFMNASPSGDDVVFLTRAQLVGSDADGAYDLYDARVGGGFQAPPTATPCAGDACQGAPSSAPEATTPGSSLITGTSKPPKPKAKPKPKRCRKGYVRKRVRGKVRCVKKPKPRKVKKANKAKRTSTLRRAK